MHVVILAIEVTEMNKQRQDENYSQWTHGFRHPGKMRDIIHVCNARKRLQMKDERGKSLLSQLFQIR